MSEFQPSDGIRKADQHQGRLVSGRWPRRPISRSQRLHQRAQIHRQNGISHRPLRRRKRHLSSVTDPFFRSQVTVKEEYIAIAILRLVEMEKAVVEGAGAVGLAAVLQGLLPELKGKRVVIPLTGGNIDTTVLGRCLERGLAADGRLVKFKVTVSDRPGGIAGLTNLISKVGVSIKDMIHERAWVKTDIFSVAVSPFKFLLALTVDGIGTFRKEDEKKA